MRKIEIEIANMMAQKALTFEKIKKIVSDAAFKKQAEIPFSVPVLQLESLIEDIEIYDKRVNKMLRELHKERAGICFVGAFATMKIDAVLAAVNSFLIIEICYGYSLYYNWKNKRR